MNNKSRKVWGSTKKKRSRRTTSRQRQTRRSAVLSPLKGRRRRMMQGNELRLMDMWQRGGKPNTYRERDDISLCGPLPSHCKRACNIKYAM
jgi:hypothetical protein